MLCSFPRKGGDKGAKSKWAARGPHSPRHMGGAENEAPRTPGNEDDEELDLNNLSGFTDIGSFATPAQSASKAGPTPSKGFAAPLHPHPSSHRKLFLDAGTPKSSAKRGR